MYLILYTVSGDDLHFRKHTSYVSICPLAERDTHFRMTSAFRMYRLGLSYQLLSPLLFNVCRYPNGEAYSRNAAGATKEQKLKLFLYFLIFIYIYIYIMYVPQYPK
jgi:hypothetical protein